MKIGFFRQVRDLKIQRKKPGSALGDGEIRASSAVLRSCAVKLDFKKSKYAGLTQKNGFGSAYLHTLWWLVKGAVMVSTCLGQG
jgi:hypothetical protein